VANRVCKRRLMNASLAVAAAWFTYVNPFTMQIRVEAGWGWLGTVIGASVLAAVYAAWAVTSGDRRTWMRAFRDATREPLEAAPGES